MKKSSITLSILSLVIAIAICINVSGCGESANSASFKRAQLIGNENIELKKQLEQKDAEIQKQKDILAQKEKEFAGELEKAGDTALKLMQIVSQSSQQTDTLTAENLKLKETIKQLEAKQAEK